LISNELIVPQAWRRGLAWSRAALALSCLASQLLPGTQSHWAVTALAGAFASYSLTILAWKHAEKASGALLGLVFDTIFFLTFSAYAADQTLWLSSAFYLYLLLSAVLLHRWADVCMVVGTSIAFFVAARPADTDALWRVVLWTGLLACVLAFHMRRLEQRLAGRTRETEELRLNAESALEAERQRIAGDFHDGPLQNFIGFQMRLEVLRKTLDRDTPSGLRELRELQEQSKSQVRELRAFLRGMRPVKVAGDNLAASLRRLVSDFQKDSSTTTTFQCGDGLDFDVPETSLEVLQIVREALHNVQKHAKATRVAVTVNDAGNWLEISIEDNGLGFPFSGSYTLEELELLRMGPMSVQRRVRSLGGQLLVESHPGRGAALKIRLPA
jgi:signal transduction histidine kinase